MNDKHLSNLSDLSALLKDNMSILEEMIVDIYNEYSNPGYSLPKEVDQYVGELQLAHKHLRESSIALHDAIHLSRAVVLSQETVS